jgi:hypothetical protein
LLAGDDRGADARGFRGSRIGAGKADDLMAGVEELWNDG